MLGQKGLPPWGRGLICFLYIFSIIYCLIYFGFQIFFQYLVLSGIFYYLHACFHYMYCTPTFNKCTKTNFFQCGVLVYKHLCVHILLSTIWWTFICTLQIHEQLTTSAQVWNFWSLGFSWFLLHKAVLGWWLWG